MTRPKGKKKFVLACCNVKLYNGEKCICHEITVIQRAIKEYRTLLHKLDNVKVDKLVISYKSINAFIKSKKNENDNNNKIRETVVSAIINNSIPEKYFKISRRWYLLKKGVDNYVERIFHDVDLTNHKVICKPRGGRKYNYDFDFILKRGTTVLNTVHIELKFNAEEVDDAPQFASPMKPSQYMTQSFEDFHYTHVLPGITKIAEASKNIKIPDKKDYMKQIHNNKPKCMEAFQKLYYEGCKGSSKFTDDPVAIAFYEGALERSKEGIRTFIQETELNHEKLTDYLLESQQGKVYMLYHENNFVKEQVNLDDYHIVSVTKNPEKSRYECVTKTGIRLNVLLRWKNGNGIAFPAFQIRAHR